MVDLAAEPPTYTTASFLSRDHSLSNIRWNMTFLLLISTSHDVCEANLNGLQNIWAFDPAILYAAPDIANQLRFLGTAN